MSDKELTARSWIDFYDSAPQSQEGGEPAPTGAQAETQEQLRAEFNGYTYVGRFRADEGDEGDNSLVSLLRLSQDLADRYGRSNVITSRVSIDPDNQEPVIERGLLGLWVNTDAKNKVDNGE